MARTKWPPVGTLLKMNAYNYPDKLGWQDKVREYTFKEWNDRACRFANGLREVGVQYNDAFAVISYNRGEWMDNRYKENRSNGSTQVFEYRYRGNRRCDCCGLVESGS